MPRPPLPRYRYRLSLILEVPGATEVEADVEAEGLATLVELRAASLVRNARGRTARVVGEPNLEALGPDLRDRAR